MKLVVVGTGQGGSNIADEFVALGKWVWKNRRIHIFTGDASDPHTWGVFAVNLGTGDLYGLQHIPQTDDHAILLGATDEFRGRGAGKINADGAEQARKEGKKITSTIGDYGDVYSADAILVIATTAGGTGSGSIGVIVDLLKDAFKKPVYAMLVLPFENQYDDPDSMANTATCLKKVLENSKADAIFLFDNEKFTRKYTDTFSQINRRIADSFMDILCVGEETDRRYVGEVLDANDVIRILKGPTAIGVSHGAVPKRQRSWFGWLKAHSNGTQHFAAAKGQIDRAKNVVSQALAELSVDCEMRNADGSFVYDAESVLGLFSGPPHESTAEIVEMMDNHFSERVPGASRRKGTYPGRTSDTISVTVIVSGLGEGLAKDQINWFYKRATSMISTVKKNRKSRDSGWVESAKLAEQLPAL